MDQKQLRELARWARQLRDSETAESRAAGRAILMLVDEVERLQAEGGGDGGPPEQTLRGRLRRFEPREERQPPVAEARAAPVDDRRAARRVEIQRRRRRARGRLAIAVAVLGALLVGSYSAAARMARPDFDAGGPVQDARIGAANVKRLVFWVAADRGTLDGTRWELDGRDVTAATRLAGDRLVYDGTKVRDGSHTLTVSASGPFPGAGKDHEWRFQVDRTGPQVRVPAPEVQKGAPVRVTGKVEAGARVSAAGRPLRVAEGRFTLAYAKVPVAPIPLVAIDAFGNRTITSVVIKLVPRRPPRPVRAVHVTADAWADESLREGVLDLIEQGRINAVELDLKDEAGIVGFDADVPYGRRIGAVKDIYDLEEAVELLHDRGARVIGRLVAFRDPIHAAAAWRLGDREQVIQAPGGQPYSGYGGFTNFANPAVRQYNIDVARAAAEAGIDEILYDYIRRPDGPLSSMVFPGLRGTAEASIARFLRESRQALPDRVFLGASVFGVAATRPHEIAQDIPLMAREVDYISPMLYPSHWGPGEYNVAYPNGQPYDIVLRSLRDFLRQTNGTGARIVPWLQDFTLGVTYGPAEVRAQIRAAAKVGIPEFLLWDPLVTYTAEAMTRGAARVRWTGRARATQPQRPVPEAGASTRLEPNELGEIPVIMYHQIRSDGGGDYDLTPKEFRAELLRLWRDGYRPVRAIDLARGQLNVPAGTTPVVLTFDDSTKEQYSLGPDGKPAPNTALGILLDFARKHPGFKATGTFYVNREPFAGVAEGPEMLRNLVEMGFELGNHTHDHIPFNRKDAEGVQEALVMGKRIIKEAVPQAQVATLALPLGVEPTPARLAMSGRWSGESYRHEGVFLVGAGPAPSPFSTSWDPGAIPRIRTGPWRGEDDFASGFWLRLLKQHPERRYVSDGDPSTITFPSELENKLAPRYRDRANPS